jgi:hypothetical protein
MSMIPNLKRKRIIDQLMKSPVRAVMGSIVIDLILTSSEFELRKILHPSHGMQKRLRSALPCEDGKMLCIPG